MASTYASDDTIHYPLLNSDIIVIDPNYFNKLMGIHPKMGGISSFGFPFGELVRVDGYCMLIDRPLYDKFQLDGYFEWWWLNNQTAKSNSDEGFKIRAVKNHENHIRYYDGKSGNAWKGARSMDITIDEVFEWFKDKKEIVEIIERNLEVVNHDI